MDFLRSVAGNCLMNDLYGVDPAAPSSLLEFSALMRLFRSGQGRFIADFPRLWFDDVRQHMKSFSDIERMHAVEMWLKVGRNALLPTSAHFNAAWSWSENAVTLSERENIAKLIGSKTCPPTQTPIDEALNDLDGFPDASGALVPRTAHAYAKVARPLLQTSPKVVLVDPYLRLREFDEVRQVFRSTKRFCETLEALFREAAKWRRVERFKFAVSETQALYGDRDGKIFKSEVRKLADKCGAQAIEIEVVLLGDRLTTHPRYLLGMHSGLRFDWGFDTGDPKSKNDIHWLGTAVLEPLLVQFT